MICGSTKLIKISGTANLYCLEEQNSLEIIQYSLLSLKEVYKVLKHHRNGYHVVIVSRGIFTCISQLLSWINNVHWKVYPDLLPACTTYISAQLKHMLQ